MSEQTDIEALLQKLAASVKSEEEITIFSKSEVVEIRKMLAGFAMFQSWGKLGKLVIWLVITAAALKVGFDNLGIVK